MTNFSIVNSFINGIAWGVGFWIVTQIAVYMNLFEVCAK